MKQFGFRVLLPDGQVLVCLGDEPYNEACKKYVEQADWLLAEAFCLYRDREIFSPYENITVLLWMPVVWPKLWG